MPMNYRHLTTEDRDRLAVLHGQGETVRAIARLLGRNPGTISRELKRNGAPVNQCAYLPHRAQMRSDIRRQNASRHDRIPNMWVRHYITMRIRRGWSPELIAGRLMQLRPKEAVSHEAIYQWVYFDAPHLKVFLVRKHKKRHKRGHSNKHAKSHIPGRIHISERPAVANERRRLGDWEADTMGSHRSPPALQVVVDRRSRYTILNLLPNKSARHMRMALNRSMCHLPPKLRRTITYDNGTENTEHLLTNSVLKTKSFFCTPYTSQEKGTVENTAGLVRRKFPKDFDFAKVSRREVKAVQYWLNHRPRKILSYKTPAEAS